MVEIYLDDAYHPIRANVLVNASQHVQYHNGYTVPNGMYLVESDSSGRTYLIRPDQIISPMPDDSDLFDDWLLSAEGANWANSVIAAELDAT